jgi:tRNA/rRNA methyltransferase
MTFWAYMLRCSDGTYYVGHSDDLERRLHQHQNGTMRGYTYSRRPVELVWSEVFEERAQAMEAERIVKGWSRAKKEAKIAGNEGRLKFFAIPPSERKNRIPERSRGALPSEAEALRTDSAVLGSARTNPSASLGKAVAGDVPILILVRPQLGENIGKAARAMLNFGMTELRLVAPRDGWPNPNAGPAASGADSVLAGAQVFDTVAEATADCAHLFATTVRKRGVVKPVMTPEEAVADIRAASGKAAILFGPERTGLETDDVALARTIITVPINPEFGSLNLAQAVMVVAYEWSRGAALAQPTLVEAEPPAPQGELDGLIDQLDALLDPAGFYFPPDKVPTMKRNIRSILTKPAWNALEVRTLRGVLTAIGKPRPKT